ncbi:hypothetical protein A5755_18620 [Mycolicibacterium fortuitum]|nr:hypothetical protein A5763_13935 [Mycolicibacterium fortuitum]OBB46459.1 hypothetical protein A5754_08715 [Mycolicibacterium fortuitum]OBB66803.1 hypothetical protein A5755_18620 [Mycolicibacterium fortuitum]OBF87682.1 hypothetical protein A5751_06270 [Mycolicibacterium fortuitum]OBG16245.1 hypothetical protein A5768_06000 [Mycolicibacterium fortuitum]
MAGVSSVWKMGRTAAERRVAALEAQRRARGRQRAVERRILSLENLRMVAGVAASAQDEFSSMNSIRTEHS